MSSHFNFSKEWELSMEQQMSRLGKRRNQIQSLTYNGFQASITEAGGKHSRAPTTIVLRKLQPVLDQLNGFVNAITSIVQASPDLAGFIWGAMQAVMQVASRFTNLLLMISEMFHELASMVVQFNRYLAIFPESSELQQCTRSFIDDYVGFSVSVFLFFKKWPIYNLLRLFWSTVDKTFEATRSNIAKHYTRFERSRQYSVDSALIHNSRKVIQMLPTVTVSPSLPSSLFEVPLLRNPHFSERGDELQLVRTYLSRPTSNGANHQSACLVQGLGGVGKTTIVLEYAYRYRGEYDFVFWIPAETDLNVSNTAAIVSRKLGLGPHEGGEKNPQLEVERFRSWLETLDKEWLLVLDNVEDVEAVSKVWPRVSHGHVLLTSQKSELAQVCSSTVIVQPLDRLSGSRFLLKQLATTRRSSTSSSEPNPSISVSSEDDVQRKAEMIAAELSGIPLAITFVAGLFSSMPLDEILTELKQQSSFTAILAPGISPTLAFYDKPFGKTWDIARKQLAPTSLFLVQTLAMLSHTGVVENIIIVDHQQPHLSILGIKSKSHYHSIVSKMGSRHLVERQDSDQGPYLLMHRVVQKHILSRLEETPEEFQQVFNAAYRLILRVFPKQSPIQIPQNDLWEEREVLSPHVLSLCVIFDNNQASLPSVGIEFAEMLTDASSYFWERGLYKEGYQTSDAAVAICDRLGNDLASAKANVYAISAFIRQDHGISQRLKFQTECVKALQMRQHHIHGLRPESTTEEDIICWANAWNDMGCVLINAGLYEESLNFFVLAWEQRKASVLCQEQYNHFPESPKNVSMALAGVGKYKEAIALISETARNTDRVFGRNCAVAQSVHFDLASILLSAGRYAEAFSEAREIYEIGTTIFGVSGRRTSDAAYLLATIEEKRGNLDKAASILQMTLSHVNGWTTEAEARAKHRLGTILMCLERKDDAELLTKSAEESLATLWGQHGERWIEMSSLDQETAFDLLVSVTAGRSTLGKAAIRGNPGLGCLIGLCGKLLERFRGEPDKSPSSLCRLLNLKEDSDWLMWLGEREQEPGPQ